MEDEKKLTISNIAKEKEEPTIENAYAVLPLISLIGKYGIAKGFGFVDESVNKENNFGEK